MGMVWAFDTYFLYLPPLVSLQSYGQIRLCRQQHMALTAMRLLFMSLRTAFTCRVNGSYIVNLSAWCHIPTTWNALQKRHLPGARFVLIHWVSCRWRTVKCTWKVRDMWVPRPCPHWVPVPLPAEPYFGMAHKEHCWVSNIDYSLIPQERHKLVAKWLKGEKSEEKQGLNNGMFYMSLRWLRHGCSSVR